MSPSLGKRIFGRRRGRHAGTHPDRPGFPPSTGEGGRASRRTERVPPLVELASDVLSLAYSLRTTPDLGEASEVRRKILQLLDHLETEGRKYDYPSQVLEGMRFPLVALLDETILNSQWAGKDSWRANPLQRELFKMNIAGEEFYTRLDRLRQNRQENRPLLELYYACLMMGFEGRFKLAGREKLEALVRGLAGELSEGHSWKMESLSPSWRRPDEFPEAVGEGVPVWATALFLVPAIFLLILLFATVSKISSGRSADVIREMVLGLSR